MGNVIDPGSAASAPSSGVDSTSTGTIRVIGNRIYAGDGSSTHGVGLEGGAGAIVNNMIHGGNARVDWAGAVWINESGVRIAHNTPMPRRAPPSPVANPPPSRRLSPPWTRGGRSRSSASGSGCSCGSCRASACLREAPPPRASWRAPNAGHRRKLRRIDMQMTMKRDLALGFDEAVAKLPEALKGEGFGVLSEIDVQATMKQKLGADFRRYRIFGACNPPLAHRALSVEIDIGVMLPCNVVVYENDDGRATVVAIDPMATIAAGHPSLRPIAEEVRAKLARALERIA